MKLERKKRIVIVALLLATITAGGFLVLFRWPSACFRYEIPSNTPTPVLEPTMTASTPSHPTYTVKQYDLDSKIKGLSKKQIDEHKELYAGYVKKRNEITQQLKTVDTSNANSRTYSPYRALKVAETYAVNGSILHELYFENMGAQDSSVGPQMAALIQKSFGSLEAFKKDFYAAANSSRGWVLTAFMLDDKLIHNFVLEEHNQTVPVLAMPLLVLDVYEHAYMIDFGIKRVPYLEVFWKNIDWNTVEQRIEKWVTPFNK
jgi:Fe-Mn family superoxide dismutase